MPGIEDQQNTSRILLQDNPHALCDGPELGLPKLHVNDNLLSHKFQAHCEEIEQSFDGHTNIAPSSQHELSSRRPAVTPPPGTREVTVGKNDSLMSLAVAHDMTKSEIVALNRMACNSVFPGQIIYVKDPKALHDYKGPSMSMSQISTKSSDDHRNQKESNKGHRSDNDSENQDDMEVSHGDLHSELDEDHFEIEIVEPLISDNVDCFVNDSMALVKVLYVTTGKGMIPGLLEANRDYVRFLPDPGMIVDEYGAEEFTLFFEHADLLQPITQYEVPEMDAMVPHVGPGGAHHKQPMEGDSSEARRHNACPQYLLLRVRLVFGQDPTPSTVAMYWFAVMSEWIDPLFELLWKHNQIAASEAWEVLSPVGSPVKLIDPSPVSTHGNLLNPSELITNKFVDDISPYLPRRQQFSDWKIAYSTYEHGMSLSTMYRHLAGRSGPCMTIVKDTKQHIFGCFTSEMWRNNEGKSEYYGGGECFLFKLQPSLRTFLWSRNNNYFMNSDEKAIMIGGGTGVAGLWLDEAFMHGSSGPTTTFNNDTLASSPDFVIDGLEVWEFAEQEF